MFKLDLVGNVKQNLKQPQPDFCVGYIRRVAAGERTTPLFKEEEEEVFIDFGPDSKRQNLLPSISGQAKPFDGNLKKAMNKPVAMVWPLTRLCDVLSPRLESVQLQSVQFTTHVQ